MDLGGDYTIADVMAVVTDIQKQQRTDRAAIQEQLAKHTAAITSIEAVLQTTPLRIGMKPFNPILQTCRPVTHTKKLLKGLFKHWGWCLAPSRSKSTKIT